MPYHIVQYERDFHKGPHPLHTPDAPQKAYYPADTFDDVLNHISALTDDADADQDPTFALHYHVGFKPPATQTNTILITIRMRAVLDPTSGKRNPPDQRERFADKAFFIEISPNQGLVTDDHLARIRERFTNANWQPLTQLNQ